MKLARVGVIAAAVFAVATMASAQAKPDFSGKWTPDVPADQAAGGGGGRGMMGPMTVTQKDDTLTVERTTGRGPMTTTYKLDGSEQKVTMGQNEGTVSAKWDGNKLVITQKFGENTTTQTWSLDAGVLTIERTGGRGPSTTKYKKS